VLFYTITEIQSCEMCVKVTASKQLSFQGQNYTLEVCGDWKNAYWHS